MLTGSPGACPRFVELNMHDIDALEIDEDDYSMHSTSSKRIRTNYPASLIPEGWPALHNTSNTVGPAGSAPSPMAVHPAQRAFVGPQPASRMNAHRQMPLPPGQGISYGSRLQYPQHRCFMPSLPAPLWQAESGHFPTSSERHQLFQPSSPPSQATLLGPQYGSFTRQGEQGLTLLAAGDRTGLRCAGAIQGFA